MAETFGDWMTARMRELDLSTRDVERVAGISHASVHRYMTGQRDPASMGEEILAGLSKALRVPEKQLRTRAGRPANLGEWTPPTEAIYLNRTDRAMLDQLVRRLAAKSA